MLKRKEVIQKSGKTQKWIADQLSIKKQSVQDWKKAKVVSEKDANVAALCGACVVEFFYKPVTGNQDLDIAIESLRALQEKNVISTEIIEKLLQLKA